jgi:hypothetical protein
MSKQRQKPKPKAKIDESKKTSAVPKVIIVVVILLCILSAAIIGATQFFNTTTLEAHPKVAGMEGDLTTELSQSSLKYELAINQDGGSNSIGVGFGIIGGGAGGGLAGGFNNQSGEALYLKGLGDFQENIGLLLNSYNTKYYTISADTSGTGDPTQRTKVNVTTHVDLIPWWPVGIKQDYEISVELAQKGAAQKIIVEEVQIQLWRKLDSTETRFLENTVLWTDTPKSELSAEGQVKKFSHSFALDEDYGLVGLLSYVRITFIDSMGNSVNPNLVSNLAEVDPDNHEIPMPLTINLRTMDRSETTRLAMLISSFPLSLASIALIILGTLIFIRFNSNHKRARIAGYIMLIAAVCQILAVIFLYVGIENLITIIDGALKTDLREDFQWSPIIYLMAFAGIIQVIASLMIILNVKKPKAEKPEPEKEETFKLISD